ncbi:MAG: hypothetical protein M4579_004339 [Chaenotheca gracillima]|nr:MAG: hypothetical protein M4579_004339 [Chaenotheca gracillima]
MDINSLLSPQDSPIADPPTSNPQVGALKRVHSASRNSKSTSSSRQASARLPQAPPPSVSYTSMSQAPPAIPSPPMASPGNGRGASGVVGTPPADVRPGPSRQGSTPGMDTLADLASMQHHQQTARVNAGGLRTAEVYDSPQLVQTPGYTPLSTIGRPKLTPHSSVDMTMSDGKSETPPTRPLTTTSLADDDIQVISQLVPYLAENPYSVESHVRLIKLLRQGYLTHCTTREPRDYELFSDLRQAREGMLARFPFDEDSWTEWIADEKRACRTAEDCVAVMELYQKAIAEECASRKLWLDFGEFMWSLYTKASQGSTDTTTTSAEEDFTRSWTEEDCALAQEIFGSDMVLDIWKQAVRETSLRINDSHLIWDRYMEIILSDFGSTPTQQKIGHTKDLFLERLQIPHTAWDQTFQSFSTFITKHDNANYEATMVNANKRAADGKSKYELRELFEIKIQRAIEAEDAATERVEFQAYLDWELGQIGKKKGGTALAKALFDRGVLRFPTDATLWEDYVFFALDKAAASSKTIDVLEVLERATRHCPWSGDLWSQYLLSSERERKSFQEIEEVKHTATKRGLMDIGGMEEVLKVHTAWCGYLNRRAFQDKATDEEADVAEVGILSALESVKELGQKKFGEEYEGDRRYRLERIYIEYLSRSNLWDRARKEVWQPLAKARGDSYEFWLRWYHWEMFQWAKQHGAAYRNVLTNQSPSSPSVASIVLRKALVRKNLDWPEKILEVLLHHLEHHESIEELQNTMILIRKTSKEVAARREREALEAQEAAVLLQGQQHQQSEATLDTSLGEDANGIKRKRESDPDVGETGVAKKARADNGNIEGGHNAQQQPSQGSFLKRDRENSTVVVKNLPLSASETKIRQYFRDCGTINSLKVHPDDKGESLTATIEFEGKEDVLSAQTRDLKSFDGNEIHIQVGTGSTLYVTNFPPTADEAFIRGQFSEFGDIVDVRFPSLKYNTHRRFCYVQFKSADQANRALALDGKSFGDKLNLVVKISEPSRRQDRTGPIHEGREVYIANLDWTANEGDISALFSKYGNVESVRIPKNLGGKSKGIAFVVYPSKDNATAALDLNLAKFKSRILYVSISESNPSKRQAISVMPDATARSASPNTPGPAQANGSAASPASESSAPGRSDAHPDREDIRSRTVGLLNIPDTVNDARVRALLEPYGALTKLILRPDHQGAIVEFSDTTAAGKASLGIDGFEISPGRNIKVGSVKELLDSKSEFKSDRITVGKKKEGNPSAKPGLGLQQTGPISRPAQPGARRGGRGGLGIKRGGVGLGGKRAGDGSASTTKAAETKSNGNEAPQSANADAPGDTDSHNKKTEGPTSSTDESAPPPKSNSDFRSMFVK